MRSIMLAVSFLKKQWVMNVVLVVEILILVIMLSELFLFVSRMDNQRAAEELQNNHLYVLSQSRYDVPQEERVMKGFGRMKPSKASARLIFPPAHGMGSIFSWGCTMRI